MMIPDFPETKNQRASQRMRADIFTESIYEGRNIPDYGFLLKKLRILISLGRIGLAISQKVR